MEKSSNNTGLMRMIVRQTDEWLVKELTNFNVIYEYKIISSSDRKIFQETLHHFIENEEEIIDEEEEIGNNNYTKKEEVDPSWNSRSHRASKKIAKNNIKKMAKKGYI